MNDREFLVQWWKQGWGEGLWASSWRNSLDGLSGEQASWRPPGAKHSIHQLVLHMVFWREDALKRLAGGSGSSDAEIASGNFPMIKDTTDAAWHATRARFEASQNAVGAALADEQMSLERIKMMLPHDVYHFGQINLLRAMQGSPAKEEYA